MNKYRMDGLSEGETLSRNIWGRLSDTAVPSVVDDDNGFESKVRRAQTKIADTSGLLPPGQQAERRELGDDLHACCARQCAEYERKSDARCNAQH